MAAKTVTDSLAKCHNRLTPIPFDRSMCPTDNTFWENLTDDEIMTIPPHIAVHAMRTGAQKGAQVISPRQIPSSYMLGRTHLDASQPFLHVVASEADTKYKWPVPDGHKEIDPRLTEGRAVIKTGAPLSRRSPASSSPVTYATSKISNPFHKAALKIKANIDFQNREDVRGDPDELAVAYARLWGQNDDFFSSLSTVTLAHLADLQSHAIATDTAFARFLGPIQDRRVVTVAVATSSTAAFGDDFAVDWNCMRVSAEAKYAMTVSTEGYSLAELALPIPVANYLAGNRPSCTMVYHPNPGISWCHGSLTFQIRCSTNTTRMKTPRVIAKELISDSSEARAADVIRLYDAAVRWTMTQMTGVSYTQNALAGSVNLLSRATSKTTSSGRTGAKAARQALMECLNSAPLAARRTLTRSISALAPVLDQLAKSEADCDVSHYCCRYLARKFQTLDGSINAKIVQAAATRKIDPDEWFSALLGQAPAAFRDISPGGYGWTVLAMVQMFNPPNDAWRGYVSSIRRVGIMAMADVTTPMPAVLPDDEPTLWDLIGLRCDTVAMSKKDMYGSSYMGVARACFVMSSAYQENGDDQMHTLFRAAGALWAFRSRCAETVRVIIAEPDTVVPTHGRHRDKDLPQPLGKRRVIATTAPYQHYWALVNGLHSLDLLDNVDLPEEVIGRVSDHVKEWGPVMDVDKAMYFQDPAVRVAISESSMIRYVVQPGELAVDMERFMDFVIGDAIDAALSAARDIEKNARHREKEIEERNRAAVADSAVSRAEAEVVMEAIASDNSPSADGVSGWDLIYRLDDEAATEIMDSADYGDDDAYSILEGRYADFAEFLSRVARRYSVADMSTTANNALR